MNTNINQEKVYKWVGYGLLYGAISFSLIFFIVVMKNVFEIPVTGTVGSTLGFWEITSWVTGTNTINIGTEISNNGVVFIIFFITSMCLLIAGFVVHKNKKITTNKFIKIASIFALAIFGVALILGLAGKVYSQIRFDGIIQPDASEFVRVEISPWLKVVESIGTGVVTYEHTIWAVSVISVLSILSVIPTVYAIIGLVNIPKYQ